MNELYKERIVDIVDNVNGRIKLLELMMDGTKRTSKGEARRYMNEIRHQMERIIEMVSIS